MISLNATERRETVKRLASLVLILLLVAAASPALLAEDGKSLYNSKCAMCHGKDGVAKKLAEGSANLNDPEWQEKTSVEEIAKLTAEGKGKMKGYADKLSAEQIQMIAEYVKTLK
jgi:cytochrome c6